MHGEKLMCQGDMKEEQTGDSVGVGVGIVKK